MMGLPFSWERIESEGGLVWLVTGDPEARRWANPTEIQLIERVEVLSEAAERARLLLHLLPKRLNRCESEHEAVRVLQTDVYEAESALQFALTGEETVLNVSEPPMGDSEANQNVSGENPDA